MPVERAAEQHVPLILSLLRATPNPPNEDEESLLPYLAEDSVFVDTDAPALCRLHRRRDDLVPRSFTGWCDVAWWSWLGGGDIEAKLGPVFGAALAAFIARGGAESLSWGISGQLSGFGATDDQRRTDADARAGAVRTMMQRDLPPNSVLLERALNGKDAYLQSTVALMAERMGLDTARLTRGR